MRRREFLAVLGGVALGPFEALAQQAAQPRIGALIVANPETYWNPLRAALQDGGYVEGRNVLLDFRSADGKPNGLTEQAAALVRSKVDVIVAIQTSAVQEAMKATKDIPIVMVSAAPVETGLVASLSRPGGNVTGLSTTVAELAAKTLEIMREIYPPLRRVGVLINAEDLALGERMREVVQQTARALNIDILSRTLGAPEDLEAILEGMAKEGVQATIAQPSLPRTRTINLAVKHRLPVIAANPSWTQSGAFMSYAADIPDICGKVAGYVDRILKGGKPADLPVQQPTRFELVINRKTAETLGIILPLSVLARADQVIE